MFYLQGSNKKGWHRLQHFCKRKLVGTAHDLDIFIQLPDGVTLAVQQNENTRCYGKKSQNDGKTSE
jgi:hypothetical protein